MKRLVIALTLAVLAAHSAPAAAQTSSSSRWLPWFGCWRPVDQRSPEEGAYVCVVPSESGAAKIITMTGDEKTLEVTVTPDGVARPVEEPGCTGTHLTQWARIGPRVFSSSEINCEGHPTRRVSGISLIGPDDEWIDVEATLVEKDEIVRVRRYRRSSDEPPSLDALPADLPARAALEFGRPLTVEDVIEANRVVSPLAIEVAIFELQRGFPLDRRQLIALDDAGVSDTVIDLMVALTFPEKFQIRNNSGGGGGWFAAGPGFFEPYYSYSLFGGPYYWNDWYDEPGNGVIVVPPPVAHGRVVNGAGYTQVAPRPPVATPKNGTRSPSSESSNSSSASKGSSGSSGASSSSSGDSGSSGGASSAGYSAGATSSDTGRTAVSR